jgi:uncharacterized glyoxalase superfamily protein PhnB
VKRYYGHFMDRHYKGLQTGAHNDSIFKHASGFHGKNIIIESLLCENPAGNAYSSVSFGCWSQDQRRGRLFNELSAGGKVTMPMNKTFWSSYFGVFTDKFGIQWMVSTSISSSCGCFLSFASPHQPPVRAAVWFPANGQPA